jgi:hypothetical protein
MNDLTRALDDISNIRNQIAEVQLFRGFGPLVIGLTGGLALGLAALQLYAEDIAILIPWIVLACISVALIGVEMWALTWRAHGANAYALLWAIIQKFLPCLIAGAAIGWIIMTQAPVFVWVLPGLWQLLIGLGVFAATSMLPRNVMFAGAWYFVAGLFVLLLSAQTMAITPWTMGIPFGFGQILLAALLHWAPEKRKEGM